MFCGSGFEVVQQLWYKHEAHTFKAYVQSCSLILSGKFRIYRGIADPMRAIALMSAIALITIAVRVLFP